MKKKSGKRLWIMSFFVLFFALANLGAVHAATEHANSNQPLKMDSVDGKAYHPTQKSNIVAMVIYRNAVNGQHVLGFTTFEKYHSYKQTHLKSNQANKPADASSYFYENTSFDSRGVGAHISLSVGYNYYYVGDNWNDRISSLDVYPSSSVTLYQHWHYEGYSFTFVNNGSGYWFRNLTDYKLPNGNSWNDQTSSIKSSW